MIDEGNTEMYHQRFQPALQVRMVRNVNVDNIT